MTRVIAVAMSGGVDSMVAACLLKEAGWGVVGLHFLTGFERDAASAQAGVERIARRLGIPLHVVDASRDFQEKVVDYFTATYLAGQTPNPCVICNPAIKFGTVLRAAEHLGAAALATGHYARTAVDTGGRFHLFKAADPTKDQSYFLARLSQRQLARARFPLAALTKEEVRAIAARKRLKPAAAEESQDVCFIKAGTVKDFIAARLPGHGGRGTIETLAGEIIAEHSGLHGFTVGQRRGINCPAAEPWYAVRLDPAHNRLVVGTRRDLLRRRCRVSHINWIIASPDAALRVHTRVRYRNREVPSTFRPDSADSGTVEFDTPLTAVAPGQAAVFYDGEEVLGGGVIGE
jgi:tRNA-specific 2-thiouridylase